MRVIIAGSRTFDNYDIIDISIKMSKFIITEIISGGADGIDSLAERYAKENNIPLKVYPADWQKHGKKAGPIRNGIMANNADALIAIWDGKSRGTKNMIETALKKKLKVSVTNLQAPLSENTIESLRRGLEQAKNRKFVQVDMETANERTANLKRSRSRKSN
jgi:hypothetical protein